MARTFCGFCGREILGKVARLESDMPAHQECAGYADAVGRLTGCLAGNPSRAFLRAFLRALNKVRALILERLGALNAEANEREVDP